MFKIIFMKIDNEELHEEIFSEISDILNENFDIQYEDIISGENYYNLVDNKYCFMINYKELEIWIDIEKRTIGKNINIILDIDISEEIKQCKTFNIRDNRLYNLKIKIKDVLSKYFDACYWIYDEQIMSYSQEAYSEINKAENLFRTFIINYMTISRGINWWENVSNSIRNSKKKNIDGFKNSLKDFNGVSTELYSLYIDELTKLVENEYVFNITFKLKSNVDLPKDVDRLKNEVKRQIQQAPNKDMNIEQETSSHFWNTELSKFFTDSVLFKETWERVCNNRNNIAHNKLLDENMYSKIINDTIYVIKELNNAIKNVSRSAITEEDREFKKKIIQETIERDLDIFDEKIYQNDEIENEFNDYIMENILEPIEDMIFFSDKDIKLEKNKVKLSNDNILFEITGINKEIFGLKIHTVYIDNSEGGESFIKFKLYNGNGEFEFNLKFTNTVSDFDEDSGTYILQCDHSFNDIELYNYDFNRDDKSNIIIRELKRFLSKQPE
ncbi:hypothetical protein CCS79_09965 [Clostridium diolis]|uniref:hypothetical protein n=1 Tax=Clostridium diolis TaxID=223919 RepID=UPI000B403FDA|nr:hypothetical protein [Clostridium diolis]OVE68232.1 hypothetical protein CCS79_09965 [Clostridium diolis]